MFKEKVTVVVFEGGGAATEIEEQMLSVRKGIALDNIKKALSVSNIDEVILSTNYPDLADRAEAAGARIDVTHQDTFHFGRHLCQVVTEHELDNVIYLGGAALPLVRESDFFDISRQLRQFKNVVVVNNVQSADLIAFTPSDVLEHIEPPDNDNLLGYLLREAGLRRILIENSARINFDLDTPVDMLILDECSSLGENTRGALDELNLSTGHLVEAMEVLSTSQRPYPEVVLLGRVGPAIMSVINANLGVRLRVFSEERGMKALQRAETGKAVSVLGYLLQNTGPEEFFEYLNQVADVAFLDTRVLFAHMKLFPSAGDRYYSDLGMVARIDDPYVARFTEVAFNAPLPVVLGGHSLVYGGLWSIMEEWGLLNHGMPSMPTS